MPRQGRSVGHEIESTEEGDKTPFVTYSGNSPGRNLPTSSDEEAFFASRGHPSQSMSNLAVSRAGFERVRQPVGLERAESLRARGEIAADRQRG